jgi:hypothetical protein
MLKKRGIIYCVYNIEERIEKGNGRKSKILHLHFFFCGIFSFLVTEDWNVLRLLQYFFKINDDNKKRLFPDKQNLALHFY